MKKLLIAACLVLSACSQKLIKKDLDVPKFELTKAAVLLKPAEVGAEYSAITIKNRTNAARLDWVKTSVPFPPGMVPNEEALSHYKNENGICAWRPIKWHYNPETAERASVAIAQLTHAEFLDANQEIQDKIVPGECWPFQFQPGEKLVAELAKGSIIQPFAVALKLVGDPKTYIGVLDMAPDHRKEIYSDRAGSSYRLHSQFKSLDGQVTHTFSLTAFITFHTFLDNFDMVLVVGNDSLTNPIPDATIDSLVVKLAPPMKWHVRQAKASGIGAWTKNPDGTQDLKLASNTKLADGQTLAFRGLARIEGDENALLATSYLAGAIDPLIGMVKYDTWRASQAAGITGYVPPRRFPEASLALAKAQVEPMAKEVLEGSPVSYYGELCQNPGQTGDQGCFGSTLSVFAQKAIHSESSAPLLRNQVVIDRESLRPSFWWKGLDRPTYSQYPTLFFWSGRPHYHPSWNPEYPEWAPRQNGDSSGWNPYDNQHFGLGPILDMYWLTGDPYLKDILVYYQTVTSWDYFTKYLEGLDAERAVGRVMRDAIGLYFVDDSTDAALKLRVAVPQKFGIDRETVEAENQKWHMPTVGTACDPRLPYCPNLTCWQTGFHMEALALAKRLGWGKNHVTPMISLYGFSVPDYFVEDGTPKSHVKADEPKPHDIYQTGGIGISWWSGWVLLGDQEKDNPDFAAVRHLTKPMIKQYIDSLVRPGDFWGGEDRWRAFE